MAHDVFISYATQDKPVADAAVAALEAAGVRCWVAPRDIIPGHNYMGSITDAIRNSKVVVLVFSADANASVHVKREIHQAVEGGLPILPLKIDDADPSDSLSYALVGTHWLDALTTPLEQHLQRLTGAVDALVGGVSRPASRSPVGTTPADGQTGANEQPPTSIVPPPSVDPRYTSLANHVAEPARQSTAPDDSPAPRLQPVDPVSAWGAGSAPRRRSKHWWLFPLLSLGLLAPVPFVRAAAMKPTKRWVISAVVVSILSIGILLWPSASEAAGAYYFIVWVGTTVFGWISGTAWAEEQATSEQPRVH